MLGALLSAFVNNVGARAMLMPLAIATARRHDLSPSSVLMPLSFATMLGGMTTLIGTPPNIIVSTDRAESGGEPFHSFDFAPVGAVVAVSGLLLLSLLGWRLIPRDRKAVESFAGSDPALAAHAVSEVAEELESREVQLLGVLREGEWKPGITHHRQPQKTLPVSRLTRALIAYIYM